MKKQTTTLKVRIGDTVQLPSGVYAWFIEFPKDPNSRVGVFLTKKSRQRVTVYRDRVTWTIPKYEKSWYLPANGKEYKYKLVCDLVGLWLRWKDGVRIIFQKVIKLLR